MKKQVFLLSLGLLFAANVFASATTTSKSASRVTDHGKTYLSVTPHFQNASPEYASMFSSNYLHDLNVEEKHGNFQVSVFGGMNTFRERAAGIFLPYGHSTLTFDGSIVEGTNRAIFANNPAESVIQVDGTTLPNIGDTYWAGGSAATSTAAVAPITAAASAGTVYADAATYFFDTNKNTSKILPWNFGITYAALVEPMGTDSVNGSLQQGTGLITNPAFKATIKPTLKYSHLGAGFALRYHFSDDKNGFFGALSTSVQHVRTELDLHEASVTKAEVIDSTTFGTPNPTGIVPDATAGAATPVQTQIFATDTFNAVTTGLNPFTYKADATATAGSIVGSIQTAYIDSGFPTATSVVTAPTSVTEAFKQTAWTYGRIDGINKITRLADIELSAGYQWTCGDSASTNWSIGLIVPTGNKPDAKLVMPAVVGNGFHWGIFTGSVTEVLLADEDDYQTSYRLDLDARYLFKNTQMRSFDLNGNEWSRYMMVWKNKAAYTAAVAAINGSFDPSYLDVTASTIAFADAAAGTADGFGYNTGAGATIPGAWQYTDADGAATPLPTAVANRTYTPGINVFTTEMNVNPGLQLRLNQALNIRGEHFRAELGWNMLSKQQERTSLAGAWKDAPAFADSSYLAGIGLNNNRTIYNDAQTTCFNAVDNLQRGVQETVDATCANPGTVSAAVPDETYSPSSLTTLAAAVLADDNYSKFAITEDQINFNSSSSPSVFSNTPYATLGWAWDNEYLPQVSVGGSYEFTAGNSSLNQWLVWSKFEIAF